MNLKPGKVGSRGTSSTLTRLLPVKHAMMTSSGATALADLLAGTANGGFAVNDDSRIIFWTRANGAGGPSG